MHCFGEHLTIRVAVPRRSALAAILTLRYRDTVTYKYGGSDRHFNNLGATHFLIWTTILQAKTDGLRVLDLGRSEYRNQGLITFKDRFGSQRSTLIYSRFTVSPNSRSQYEAGADNWAKRVARAATYKMSTRLFCTLGSLIYKHIG